MWDASRQGDFKYPTLTIWFCSTRKQRSHLQMDLLRQELVTSFIKTDGMSAKSTVLCLNSHANAKRKKKILTLCFCFWWLSRAHFHFRDTEEHIWVDIELLGLRWNLTGETTGPGIAGRISCHPLATFHCFPQMGTSQKNRGYLQVTSLVVAHSWAAASQFSVNVCVMCGRWADITIHLITSHLVCSLLPSLPLLLSFGAPHFYAVSGVSAVLLGDSLELL